jgi:hypothetical protein
VGGARAEGPTPQATACYYARFRITDAQGRVDTRRVTAERRNGRFTKARGFYLIETCA